MHDVSPFMPSRSYSQESVQRIAASLRNVLVMLNILSKIFQGWCR